MFVVQFRKGRMSRNRLSGILPTSKMVAVNQKKFCLRVFRVGLAVKILSFGYLVIIAIIWDCPIHRLPPS